MRSEWYFHKQAVFEADMLASSTTTVEKINVQVEHAAGMSKKTSGTNVHTVPPKTDIWIMDGHRYNLLFTDFLNLWGTVQQGYSRFIFLFYMTKESQLYVGSMK